MYVVSFLSFSLSHSLALFPPHQAVLEKTDAVGADAATKVDKKAAAEVRFSNSLRPIIFSKDLC